MTGLRCGPGLETESSSTTRRAALVATGCAECVRPRRSNFAARRTPPAETWDTGTAVVRRPRSSAVLCSRFQPRTARHESRKKCSLLDSSTVCVILSRQEDGLRRSSREPGVPRTRSSCRCNWRSVAFRVRRAGINHCYEETVQTRGTQGIPPPILKFCAVPEFFS